MGVSPVLSSEENAGETPTPPKNSQALKRTLRNFHRAEALPLLVRQKFHQIPKLLFRERFGDVIRHRRRRGLAEFDV